MKKSTLQAVEKDGEALLHPLLNKLSLVENSLKKQVVINENEKILLKKFIEKIPAAIAIFDQNLNYIITSDRWVEETNAPTKDLIGKNHYQVVPDIPQKWRTLHARCLKGEHLKSDEDKFKRRDGTLEWLRWEILPWYNPEGNIGGIIMFIEHITKRKSMERKLKRTIKALNHSNIALEKFAHICAHDLNEPLRTIENYCQLIEKDLGKALEPQMRSYFFNITKGVQQMNAIVNGILAYSQFESPSLNMIKCSLQKILSTVLILLEKQIEDKKAFIYYDTLPDLFCDKILISRLFQNLISNSLKFNESDMPIIYITAKEQKDFWMLTIEDNGIGIDPQYHGIIFDLFKKLHSKAKYDGTGIGLSLCKKIVEAHGGKIWIHSSLQEGTQVSFTLSKRKANSLLISK